MKEEIKKIIWISGRSGYGKTTFAYSIIKEFEGKNKIIKELRESNTKILKERK